MHQAGRVPLCSLRFSPLSFPPVPQTQGGICTKSESVFLPLFLPFSHLQKGDPPPATAEAGAKAANWGGVQMGQQQRGGLWESTRLFSVKKH